jgi:cytochrome c oxidase subunit II
MIGVLLGVAVPVIAVETAPPRTIEVTASRFRFDPPAIELEEGEHVFLLLRSADGTHGFSIKDYAIKARIPKGGEVVRLELVASKVGRFEIACSEYCGSGHRGMKGTLLVKARVN